MTCRYPVWSDDNQNKYPKYSSVFSLTIISLPCLWSLGYFFSYLIPFLFLFSFAFPSTFLFLPASFKSLRCFNASLSAFDSLSEARFVRARAVCFAAAVCFR